MAVESSLTPWQMDAPAEAIAASIGSEYGSGFGFANKKLDPVVKNLPEGLGEYVSAPLSFGAMSAIKATLGEQPQMRALDLEQTTDTK